MISLALLVARLTAPNAWLADVLGNYKVGDEVRVTFMRDGREQTTTLRLQAPQP